MKKDKNCKALKKLHFKKRMKERYGLQINNKDIGEIKEILKKSGFEYTKKQSNSRQYFLLQFRDMIIYIVYDKSKNIPLTALPLYNFFNTFRKKKIRYE